MAEAVLDDAVLTGAVDAFRSWAAWGLSKRLAALQDAALLLNSRREQLFTLAREETGSDEGARGVVEEVMAACDPDRMAGWAAEQAQWVGADQHGDLWLRRPDGVVLLVLSTASPLVEAAPLFSLLLPGNAVICRAPTRDAGVRFLALDVLGGALVARGVPEALISVVTGRRSRFLERFLPQTAVRTVVFAGDPMAGDTLAEQAHVHGKNVVRAPRGRDDVVLWRDADLAGAAQSVVRAVHRAGPAEGHVRRVLVHEAAVDGFVVELQAALAQDAGAPVERLSRLADPDRFVLAVDDLLQFGAVVCGGARVRADGRPDPEGLYAAATVGTVDASVLAGRTRLAEASGPLVLVVRVRGSDGSVANQMSRLLEDGGVATVWVRDPDWVTWFAQGLGRAQQVSFNDACDRRQAQALWMQTSRLQGLGCRTLNAAQRAGLLETLGLEGMQSESVSAEPPAVGFLAEDGVVTLTLQRSNRHNAIDSQVLRDLETHLRTILKIQDQVHAVVIRGEGASFCGGVDDDAFLALDAADARRFLQDVSWVFGALRRLPIPVIAQVHGYCMGMGLELALHCDELVSADEAVFAFPEARSSLQVVSGTVARLNACVGPMQARRLLLSGQPLTGRAARDLGLVTAVCPPEVLEAQVWAHTEMYRDVNHASVQSLKRVFHSIEQNDVGTSQLEDGSMWSGE